MIDLDMEELEKFCGYHSATDGTQTTWRRRAARLHEWRRRQVHAGRRRRHRQRLVYRRRWRQGQLLKSAPTIRHLKGFATKDYASLTGDYAEQLPPIYTAYWTANGMTATEAAVWAIAFITKDYSAISKDSGTNQLIKKGANYQAVWMYVLHELEDAISDCKASDITANDGRWVRDAQRAATAWDEGWAFYAGSQVAATAAAGSWMTVR